MTYQSSEDSRSSAPSNANQLLGLVVIAWLLATAAFLWWFQSQQVRPFVSNEDDPRQVQVSQLQKMLSPLLSEAKFHNGQALTLIHFWNPNCLCNQLSQRHFEGLLNSVDAEHLNVLVVAAPGTSASEIARFQQLNGERMKILRAKSSAATSPLKIPSSPALALMHGNGDLGYFGAWGFGALCTLESDDFFPSIVEKMLAGPYGPFANISGNGCFCAWPGAQ